MNITYVRNPFAGLTVTVVSETPTELVIDSTEPVAVLDARLAKDGWVRTVPPPAVAPVPELESDDADPPVGDTV